METVTCLVVAGMCEIVNGNSYMLGSSRYVWDRIWKQLHAW